MVNSKFLDAIVANTEIFSPQPDAEDHGRMCAIYFVMSLMRSFADTEPGPLYSHSHEHEHGGDGHSHSHSHDQRGGHTYGHSSPDHGASEGDMDKVKSTLKQLVRDWSEEVSDKPLLNQGQMQNPRRERGSARPATLQ